MRKKRRLLQKQVWQEQLPLQPIWLVVVRILNLGPGVKEAGGLAIIGTERHESRRVDRQLRGRAGRQGDPGTSQFFVSLEDDLMRMFGSERIACSDGQNGL